MSKRVICGEQANSRYVNYDMLRILAAWLIIVLHLSAGYGCYGMLPAFSRIGVPIFIMITGTFLLNPDKDLPISLIFTRYLPKIIVIFLGWSAFYAFYVQGVFDGLGLSGGTAAGGTAADTIDWELFRENLVAGHYHMWYLYMLAGLYLITPFVRCITEARERTIIAYFLTLCVIITSVTKLNDAIWHFGLLDVALDKLALMFVFGYVGYYIAGHYYDHYALFAVERGALYIVGLGAFAFTVWYTLQTSDTTAATQMEATGMPAATTAAALITAPTTAVLYSNYSPTVFLMSFAVFASCAAWRRHNFGRRWSRFIGIFPKYMLVVYLVHPFVISELSNRLILRGAVLTQAYGVPNAELGSLFQGISGTIESTLAIDAVIVFAVSLLISIILMQLYFVVAHIKKRIFK